MFGGTSMGRCPVGSWGRNVVAAFAAFRGDPVDIPCNSRCVPVAIPVHTRGNPVAISVHSNGTELVAGQIGASFEEAKEEGENKIGCIVSIMGVHTHQHYEHSSSAFSGAFSGTGAWAKRRIWGKGAVSIDIGRMNREDEQRGKG